MIYTGRDDGAASINDRYFKRTACMQLKCAQDFCNVEYISHEAPQARVSDLAAARVGLLGFASDIGITRNFGRAGAQNAPAAIREFLGNFATPHGLVVHDYGDIRGLSAKKAACTAKRLPQNSSTPGFTDSSSTDASLENADYALHSAALEILQKGEKLLVLGGGHESSFAPICAVIDGLKSGAHLGVISFSSHLNVRAQAAHTSGNSFSLAHAYARAQGVNLNYLCVGACAEQNTSALRQNLGAIGALAISDVDFELARTQELARLIDASDALYVSVSMDVLAGVQGCSAPAAMGISAARLSDALRSIFASNKVIAADLSELAPELGSQHDVRTAALLAARLISGLSGLRYS